MWREKNAWVFVVFQCLADLAFGGDALLRDDFRGAALDPSWKVDVSGQNRVTVKDGVLEIEALENTFAHIARPLGVEGVRASCAIKPGPAVTWCTSISLYWGPGDWCQMGVIDRDGGVYYISQAVEGAWSEDSVGRAPSGSFSTAGIELAEDCLRFVSRPAGGDWKCEQFRPRPPSFKGSPAFLIVGKGHGRGDAESPRPHLDNDFRDPGPKVLSWVREVVVEKLDSGRARATAEEKRAVELAGRDTLGEELLRSGADPTFEKVAAIFPAMKRPREAVGVKDHPRDAGVAPDGSLQVADLVGAAGSPVAFFEVGKPPARFGSGAEPVRKSLLGGYLPIVVAGWRHDGLELEETVFAWSEGMSPDRELAVFARLSVKNPGDEARTVDVSFKVEPATAGVAPVVFTLPVPAHGAQSASVRVGAKAEEVKPADLEAALEEVKSSWQKLLNSGVQISVPEERINNAWRAWLAYSFIDVDKKNGVFEPHDGAGFYEEVYGYSAALCPIALDGMGFGADAETYLDSLLTFQREDGLFTSNFGTPDPGALLLALSEHYRITGKKAWLETVAPRMVKMCDWIIGKRKESMLPAGLKRTVTHGLIKFRPYCDYQTPAYDYFGDAYCCVGMEAAASVLAAGGLPEHAERIAREAALYRGDILSSMDRSAIVRDGMKVLPMEPETLRLLKDSQWKAGGYYGLVASCLLESGFLEPSDHRARWVREFLEKKGGLILGMSEFTGGVDHAYTYGYWIDCLRRGEAERVVLGLYGSLAYGMTRDTFSSVEATHLKTGDNEATLPHLYSATQQLRLLRMMLVREEGEDLLIGAAIPRHWLEAGQKVSVRGAPTRFGPVSFEIESRVDRGAIRIRLDGPLARPPRSIQVRLRHPRKAKLVKVEGGGPALKGFVVDTVILDPPAARIEVEAIY
jgi:hypothetical protein